MSLKDMKAPSSEFITPDSPTDDGAPTTAGPYRLYKQRWLGVFAMASTTSFFAFAKY
jgi:hypothetical protein